MVHRAETFPSVTTVGGNTHLIGPGTRLRPDGAVMKGNAAASASPVLG
jgi:hypothetical protein